MQNLRNTGFDHVINDKVQSAVALVIVHESILTLFGKVLNSYKGDANKIEILHNTVSDHSKTS